VAKRELVSWLKSEHGVTHGYANLIAHYTLKSDAGSIIAEGGDLVAEMFAGDKAAMRPIFDALMQHIRGFGRDIEEAPKKGYLSLRRKTQFATLHPSTKTRFDVGLKLKGVAPRTSPAAGSNAMVTHRVRLRCHRGDAELAGWLRQAYDAPERSRRPGGSSAMRAPAAVPSPRLTRDDLCQHTDVDVGQALM
jgi:hypothetical protein